MVMLKKNLQKGFTIVELLIVVVVIGILAAIVTVAYTGISRNARDVSVQSDLKNFSKVVELYRVENSAYPTFAQLAAYGGVKVNKAQYEAGASNNLYYCISTDGSRFVVGATAESSRQGYTYDSVDGLQYNAVIWGATTCPGTDGTPGLPYTGAGIQVGCAWAAGACVWNAAFN